MPNDDCSVVGYRLRTYEIRGCHADPRRHCPRTGLDRPGGDMSGASSSSASPRASLVTAFFGCTVGKRFGYRLGLEYLPTSRTRRVSGQPIVGWGGRVQRSAR